MSTVGQLYLLPFTLKLSVWVDKLNHLADSLAGNRRLIRQAIMAVLIS